MLSTSGNNDSTLVRGIEEDRFQLRSTGNQAEINAICLYTRGLSVSNSATTLIKSSNGVLSPDVFDVSSWCQTSSSAVEAAILRGGIRRRSSYRTLSRFAARVPTTAYTRPHLMQ
jgi:hypothetical protein